MLNSYDEWSALKEVIVGSAIHQISNDTDLSFKLFYYDTPASSFWYPRYEGASGGSSAVPCRTPTNASMRQYVEELNEDISGLVDALVSLGVTVRRPISLSEPIPISTPYWSTQCSPPLNIRDQAIIFGDEIIETPPQIRSRYFENDLLKPIFYDYFEQGARWTVMPRPVMTDRSFDLSYVSETSHVRWSEALRQRPSPFDVGLEMLIDAAQCIRFGRDVLVNVATRNHEKGLQWLTRHLDGRFRFHPVYRMADNHIDSIVLPLRPGLLLLRHERYRELLPAVLRRWDVIVAPDPETNHFPTYEDNVLVLTSKYIDLNVLSVDESIVIVNSLSPELMKRLESYGFTVVGVRHRHRRIFGGGFHCFTLDTVRTGEAVDYFT